MLFPYSRSVLIQLFRLSVCDFFFQLKLIARLHLNCLHITKSLRLTFEFFFVEFPLVANGKTLLTFPLNRSLICRQTSKALKYSHKILKTRTLHNEFFLYKSYLAVSHTMQGKNQKTLKKERQVFKINFFLYMFNFSNQISQMSMKQITLLSQ